MYITVSDQQVAPSIRSIIKHVFRLVLKIVGKFLNNLEFP